MRARRSTAVGWFVPALAALVWLVLPVGASSAAESDGSEATATCTANGTALQITAYDNKFDKDCMAVPPDRAFTIEFTNDDRGIPHNVSIYDTSGGTEKTLFKGDLIDSGTIVYNVPAIPAGTYLFRCDPHPEIMKGTFIAA